MRISSSLPPAPAIYDVSSVRFRTQTMSGEMPILQNGAPLQYRPSVRARIVFLGMALIVLSGCLTGPPQQEQASGPPAERPPDHSVSLPAIPLESPRKSEEAEVQEASPQLPGTGQTAWAQGFEGDLIVGLDGALYVAYDAATIKHVQSVMTDRGLYSGPLNGVLDPPTMESIYTFQKANPYLLRCGVPTPRTRKLLEQGSHTDVVFLNPDGLARVSPHSVS